MEKILAVESSFQDICKKTTEILDGYEGYFIERVLIHTTGAKGSMDIFLQSGSKGPDISISLSGLIKATVADPAEGAFVDKFKVEYIPKTQESWPPGLSRVGQRHTEIPDLVWLVLIGPMSVDVVASTISVSIAQT
jgi:hypothetical protein